MKTVDRGKDVQNKSKMHWIVAAMLCGLTITAIGLPVMTNGVFITPIADDLGVYRGTVSMHNTLTMLMKALMSLYVPVLLNRFSFKKVLITGVLIASLSNYLLGWVNAIWLFNILGTTRGIGTGMLAWVPVTIVVNEWFEERHGLVMSIVLSFSSVTGAIFSPVFTYLIESMGWASSYRLMGIFMLLFSLPAILIPFTMNPVDSGYLPYGKKEVASSDKEKEVIPLSEKREFSTVLFVMLFVFILFETMLVGTPQHFPGFAPTVGLSTEVGATMLSVAMVSSILFKVVMGYISDQIGPVNSTITVLTFVALSSGIILFTNQAWALYIASFLFGGIFAVPSVSITLLTKEFFGRYNFTRLYPIFAFSTSLGAAVSLSVVGFIFDFTGSYLPAFMISVGINIMNIVLLLIMTKKFNK
jgi:MFS family permease